MSSNLAQRAFNSTPKPTPRTIRLPTQLRRVSELPWQNSKKVSIFELPKTYHKQAPQKINFSFCGFLRRSREWRHGCARWKSENCFHRSQQPTWHPHWRLFCSQQQVWKEDWRIGSIQDTTCAGFRIQPIETSSKRLLSKRWQARCNQGKRIYCK